MAMKLIESAKNLICSKIEVVVSSKVGRGYENERTETDKNISLHLELEINWNDRRKRRVV